MRINGRERRDPRGTWRDGVRATRVTDVYAEHGRKIRGGRKISTTRGWPDAGVTKRFHLYSWLISRGTALYLSPVLRHFLIFCEMFYGARNFPQLNNAELRCFSPLALSSFSVHN